MKLKCEEFKVSIEDEEYRLHCAILAHNVSVQCLIFLKIHYYATFPCQVCILGSIIALQR